MDLGFLIWNTTVNATTERLKIDIPIIRYWSHAGFFRFTFSGYSRPDFDIAVVIFVLS
jgi:hypothetical protein